jgi:hypothetical protein
VTHRDDWNGDDQLTDTLARFLLARLSEDERIAQAARDVTTNGSPPVGTPLTEDLAMAQPGHLAAHVARHDPERVLREVAAKRAVVRSWLVAVRRQLVQYRDPDGIEVAEEAIAHLAAVYADHPDFRPSWLPHSDPQPEQPPRIGVSSDRGGRHPDNVITLRTAERHPSRRLE